MCELAFFLLACMLCIRVRLLNLLYPGGWDWVGIVANSDRFPIGILISVGNFVPNSTTHETENSCSLYTLPSSCSPMLLCCVVSSRLVSFHAIPHQFRILTVSCSYLTYLTSLPDSWPSQLSQWNSFSSFYISFAGRVC